MSPNAKHKTRNILKFFLYLLYVAGIAGGLTELVYRLYVVDFYRPELVGLNTPEQLAPRDTTLLVGGDSFTADPRGYVEVLREAFPRWRVVNAGVPGTGMVQASLFLPKRIREFEPDIFIYQLYVGNDLLDIRHPWNGQTLGFARNLYWWTSDRLRSLAFFNFRLAGLRYRYYSDFDAQAMPKAEEAFSPTAYSPRQRLYFRAEPYLVEHSARLEGGREEDFEVLADKLEDLLSQLDSSCKVLLVVIPHCMQVDSLYLARMQQVGAEVTSPSAVMEADFPFVQRLEEKFSTSQVQVLNFLAVIREAGIDPATLYYPNDPHLTPEGQQILGHTITRLIKTHNSP